MLFAKINIILMILGVLFEINLFKSYPNSIRFGYNGILPQQGIGTYFYCLILSISYFKFYLEKESLFSFLFILFGSFLIGTKGMYLFITLLLYISIILMLKSKKNRIFFLVIINLIVFIFREKILGFYIERFNFWEGNTNFQEHSFLTKLTSKRDLLFNTFMENILINWKWNNYLFGGENFEKHRVEFEIADILLLSGISGLIVFLIFIIKIIFNNNNNIVSLLMAGILIVSFFAGNLLLSITNTLFFILTYAYLSNFNKCKLGN